MSYALPREQMLKSRKEIGELFDCGRKYSQRSVRAIYMPAADGSASGKLMVSVPKRLFKRAVDRNLLKRRLREAFRLNRHLLPQLDFRIALLYTSGEIADYRSIEESVVAIFVKISSHQSPLAKPKTPEQLDYT